MIEWMFVWMRVWKDPPRIAWFVMAVAFTSSAWQCDDAANAGVEGVLSFTEVTEGVQRAARLVHDHRLWELYLITHADVAPSKVDRDADRTHHRALRAGLPLQPAGTVYCPVDSIATLRKVYTPGVADVCLRIADDPSQARLYTTINRTVAIVTDAQVRLRGRLWFGTFRLGMQ